jgi:hypothetical protein
VKDHTVPFALGALLGLIGAFSSLLVTARGAEHAKTRLGADPGSIRTYVTWAADAAQAFVATAAPITTGLAFVKGTSSEIGLAYGLVLAVGFGIFGWVLYCAPDTYASRKFLGLTIVPRFTIGINVLMGLLIQVT